MGIIAGLKGKGKTFLGRLSPDWVILAILLLSSTGAFGMGFLAGRDVGEKSELKIIEREMAAPELRQESAIVTEGGQYVGSRNGTKYHLPWCSGAKNITEANKVWFASKEDAEAKGYTPAGNCPGI